MSRKALIVVDVQRDFCTGGSLAVPNAEAVLPFINHLMGTNRQTKVYDAIVLTQDFHPENHISFASSKRGGFWPDHCVAGQQGADFHPGLYTMYADAIIRKGTNVDFDSYSGFTDDGGQTTGLDAYLKAKGITEIDIVGLATDYCDKATALDGLKAGYRVNLLVKGCQGVNLKPTDVEDAIQAMQAAGVNIVR